MPQLKPTNNLQDIYNNEFSRQMQTEKMTSRFSVRGLLRNSLVGYNKGKVTNKIYITKIF
jgi:hypothetical protein